MNPKQILEDSKVSKTAQKVTLDGGKNGPVIALSDDRELFHRPVSKSISKKADEKSVSIKTRRYSKLSGDQSGQH